MFATASLTDRARKRVAAVAALALAMTGLPAGATAVDDPGAVAVVQGLRELAIAFGGTAALPALAEPMPLTDVGIRDVLELERVLAVRLDEAVAAGDATLATLPEVVSRGDGLTLSVVAPLDDAPDEALEWRLDVDITQDRPVPLSYRDEGLRFGAAELAGELAANLAGSFRVRYDAAAPPLLQFSVVGEQHFDVRAWTRPTGSNATTAARVTVPSFPVVDGFVEVAASGETTADVALDLRMRDPNGRGAITREDLEFGIAEDLYTISDVADGAVEIDLDLRTPLLPADAVSAVRAAGAPGDGPWPAVVVTRSPELRRLSSVTAGQALGGFASFTGALLGIEGSVDAELPLLEGRLTDLFAPGEELAALVTEQATARILCGAANTTPPSGAPRPGRPLYCQAVTEGLDADPGTVSWDTLDPGTTITEPASGTTVGSTPTANVRIDDAPGIPHLVVDFAIDGEDRRARSVIGSVQTLGAVLHDVGLGGVVSYDAGTAALEVELAVATPDATVTLPTGSATGLAPLTGLSGLCAAVRATVRECPQTGQAPGAVDVSTLDRSEVDVDVSGRSVTATFGLGLLPDGAELGTIPDVYLRPGTAGEVWRIADVDATLDGAAALAARIGFLQVDVDLTDFDLSTPDGVLAARATVPTGAIELHGEPSRAVSGVVRVRDLLAGAPVDDDGSTTGGQSAPAIEPAITRSVEVAAVLDVADAPTTAGVRLLEAAGEVTASWDDIGPDTLPSVTTTPGYDELRLLDLVPTVLAEVGNVAATAAGDVLTLPAADLLRDLGLSTGDIGTPLASLDRRAQQRGTTGGCTAITVLSATSLRCDEPVAEDQIWATGDLFELVGDPEALRDGLLADLATTIAILEEPDDALGATDTFPLLDLAPAQISAARGAIANGVATVLGLADAEADDPATAGRGPVSTLQRFTGALAGAIGDPTLTIALDERDARPHLELEIADQAAADVAFAPLRVAAGERLLRVTRPSTAEDAVAGDVEDVEVSVRSDSTARVRLAVDLVDGTTDLHRDTQVVEQVLGLVGPEQKIAGATAEFGAADWTVGAEADIRVGIAVQQVLGLGGAGAAWTPLGEAGAALEAVRSALPGAIDCGVTGAPSDTAACAVVPLEADPVTETVAVALRANESSGGEGGPLPAELPLAIRFLGDGLTFLGTTLENGLNGDLAGTHLPLVGADLDAGAEIGDALGAFANDARRRMPDVVPAQDLDTFLDDVTDAMQQSAATLGYAEVTTAASASCGGACPTDATVADAIAVEFPLHLETTDVTQSPVPFGSGLPGAKLDSVLDVDASSEWSLDVTLGIKRGTGPYVSFDAPASDGLVQVLEVEVAAELPEAGGACHGWSKVPDALASEVPADGTGRCIDAVIGYQPSVLVDLGDTGLDATVTVAVAEALGATEHHLPALLAGLPLGTDVVGTGGLDVFFEGWASELGFFDTVGTIDLDWVDGAYADDLAFDDLHLDVVSLAVVLGPAFLEAKEWLRTIEPVLESLSAPVPVASDLSRMAGGPDVTLLSLMVAGGGQVELLTNLLAFKAAIDALPDPDAAFELLPMGLDAAVGSFTVPTSGLLETSCEDRIKNRGTGKVDNSATCNEAAGPRDRKKKANGGDAQGPAPENESRGKKMQRTTTSPIISVPSIALPVLEDARATYDLLLGRRGSDMVTVDLGVLGAEVGVDRAFGPFMVGPVPVFANIGGSLAVVGRFSFGFDTDGLTRLIITEERGDVTTLASLGLPRGEVMKQGFYIDDLDGGVDVPEITIVFTLYAGASVSIGIATAGLRGGAELDILLDAHDPDRDGRIRINEFAGSSGRSCAFNVSSGLTFFLDFFVQIELLVKTFYSSWRVLQSPRIELFDFPCANEQPLLAVHVPEAGELRLTAGAYRPDRNAFFDIDKDRYTVRQLTDVPDDDGNIVVEVAAFQLTQTFKVPPTTTVVADGAAGDDSFRFHPGQQVTTDADGVITVATVPFALTVRAFGGAGKDTIETADGPDVVYGDRGVNALDTPAGTIDDGTSQADVIATGFGDDTVFAGPGGDVVDTGVGNDRIEGGPGGDHITTGPGADVARGGPGDDRMTGGRGTDPASLFATDEPDLVALQLDGGDLLIGEGGSDVVDGGHGSDIVVGGDYDLPFAIGTAVRRVTGVAPADGQQLTFDVTYPTIVLPDEDEIRRQCAQPGTGSAERDDVSGGFERDYLVGGGGPDRLAGGAADDLLCGRGGDDTLIGDGDDMLPDEAGPDELLGGPGRDRIYGGIGADVADGGPGDDLLRGDEGADVLTGGAGSDLLLGGDGQDTLLGDGPGVAPSREVDDGRRIRCAEWTTIVDGGIDLNGDLSTNGADDGALEGLRVVDGRILDHDESTFDGELGRVIVVDGLVDLDGDGVGGAGDDGVVELARITGAVGDGDCLFGGPGAEVVLDGGPGGDRIDAGIGDDRDVRGGDGDDLVRGGPGDDQVFGQDGDDLVVGDSGDDLVEGNVGDDRVRGGAGDDLLLGGSQLSGEPDGTDVLLGDRGDDVLAGGNALLVRVTASADAQVGDPRPVPTADVTLLPTPIGPPDADGYDDQLFGGFGEDVVLGQEGNDLVRGGHDDDLVEGGPGADRVQGDDGADRVVGGSSGAIGEPFDENRDATGVPDGADDLFGDGGVDDQDGEDVIAGDNARLDLRPSTPRERWPDHRPEVTLVLFDVPTAAPVEGSFGVDTIEGGGARDLVLGQSGDDIVAGGDGDDAIEGNAGSDDLDGGGGRDAILGGSWTEGVNDQAPAGIGDEIDGGPGDDVLLGDNGTVLATVTLLDVPTDNTTGSTASDDVIVGGAGADTIFGQSGSDTLFGGHGDDAIEGGAGGDTIDGGGGDDAIVGGGSADDGRIVPDRRGDGLPDGADTIQGGAGDDVITGDNARVVRQPRLRADGTRWRTVLLFDVLTVGDAASSGGGGADTIRGNAGRDLVFGQGGPDELHGGPGDDVLEGNAGDDTIAGDGGEDDLLGGGSATDGEVIGAIDRLLVAPTGLVDTSAADLLDGDDVLYGGAMPGATDGIERDSHDVLLGDNGRITRPGSTLLGATSVLDGGDWSPRRVRWVAMADVTPGPTSGSDVLIGDEGDDDLYGQLDATDRDGRARHDVAGVPVLGDLLVGGPGDDALVGDLGVDTPTPAGELGDEAVLRTRGDFVVETVLQSRTLVRVVELVATATGGDDVLLGDGGRDHLHAGAGVDHANGGAGDDAVFGGDGDDALWGGVDHDRVYGGDGADSLDVKPRPTDGPLWPVVAPVVDTDGDAETSNDSDLLYGGFGPDALQADVGAAGPVPGDRLLDWVGAYNVYYVCEGAYGAGRTQRRPDPTTQQVLIDLATADGAVDVATVGSSGWHELRIVTTRDNSENNSPRHPDHPGNFTCEGATASGGEVGSTPDDEGGGASNGKAGGKGKSGKGK